MSKEWRRFNFQEYNDTKLLNRYYQENKTVFTKDIIYNSDGKVIGEEIIDPNNVYLIPRWVNPLEFMVITIH